MLNQLKLISLTALSVTLLTACGGDDVDDIKKVEIKTLNKTTTENNTASIGNKRWYTTAQLIRGRKIFKENCAECHGDKGQGLVENWREAQPDGKYPAPPLNGMAHTWHHSKQLLLNTVNNGGIALGGSMPAFKDKLSDKDKEAAVAFVTSLWSDKTYSIWAQRNQGK